MYYGAAFLWRWNLLKNQQDDSGLMYRRNRYYDPQTGRFTQVDPIGPAGGLNFYGFANGDPVNFSDPFGLCPPEDTYDGPHCRRWFKRLIPNVSTAIAGFVRLGHKGISAAEDLGQSVDDLINDYDGPLKQDADEKRDIPDNRKPHDTGGRPSTKEKHEDTRNPSKDRKRQHDDWKQNPNKRPKRVGSDPEDQ